MDISVANAAANEYLKRIGEAMRPAPAPDATQQMQQIQMHHQLIYDANVFQQQQALLQQMAAEKMKMAAVEAAQPKAPKEPKQSSVGALPDSLYYTQLYAKAEEAYRNMLDEPGIDTDAVHASFNRVRFMACSTKGGSDTKATVRGMLEFIMLEVQNLLGPEKAKACMMTFKINPAAPPPAGGPPEPAQLAYMAAGGMPTVAAGGAVQPFLQFPIPTVNTIYAYDPSKPACIVPPQFFWEHPEAWTLYLMKQHSLWLPSYAKWAKRNGPSS